MTQDLNLNSKKLFAIFQIALSASLYGCMGYLGTSLLQEHMSTSTMLFWRFLIAAIWVAPWLLRQPRMEINVKNSTLFYIFLLGFFFYSGCSGLYFLASERIGTGSAMVIFFSYPLLVVLFAWLFEKRPISFSVFSALFGILVGLFFLKGQANTSLNFIGILLALLAALSYAIYVFVGQKIARKLPANFTTLLVCLGCTTFFLICALITHSWMWPTSYKMLFYIIVLGIFATALPIQLLLEGMKVIHSSKASLLSVLEPVVTVLLGIILLNESFSMYQLFGGLIILISSILIQLTK